MVHPDKAILLFNPWAAAPKRQAAQLFLTWLPACVPHGFIQHAAVLDKVILRYTFTAAVDTAHD